MPSFEVFGAFAVVAVLLWMRGEDFRKRAELAEGKIDEEQERAARAVKLLDDVVAFSGQVARELVDLVKKSQ
jgi:hypothetical protein